MSPVKDSAEEPVWWAIENLPRRCTSKGGTPSKLIETAQTAQQPYETQDKTDAATGQVVQTTVSFPNQGASITFYRGRAGCEDFLNTENNTRKADVDRYK